MTSLQLIWVLKRKDIVYTFLESLRVSINTMSRNTTKSSNPIGKVIIPNHGKTSQAQFPSLLHGIPVVSSEILAMLIPTIIGLNAINPIKKRPMGTLVR